jgi:hypothetical protein
VKPFLRKKVSLALCGNNVSHRTSGHLQRAAGSGEVVHEAKPKLAEVMTHVLTCFGRVQTCSLTRRDEKEPGPPLCLACLRRPGSLLCPG